MTNASREASKILQDAVLAEMLKPKDKTANKKLTLNDEKERKRIKKLRKEARRKLEGK